MLDYAANATKYWPIETIINAFNEKYIKDGKEPAQVIHNLLGIRVDDENGLEEFWSKVQENLQEGIIRMLFVADKIPDELRRIIEFLNEQMTKSEVLGIEIKQYCNLEKNIKTLVPSVIGISTNPQKTQIKLQWNLEQFMNEIENKLGHEGREVHQEIFQTLSTGSFSTWYGKGQKWGSIFFLYDGANRHNIISMWTYGLFEIQFQHLKNHPPFSSLEKRREFQLKFKELLAVEIPDEHLNLRPSFSWEKVRSKEQRNNFYQLMDWAVNQIRNYEGTDVATTSME